MEIFDLVTRHSSMPGETLDDVELPEHVLIEGVVDVKLDPVQTGDALREMLGKVSKQAHGIRLFHFGHDRVRSPTLFRIKGRAYRLAAVGETLGKKSKVE